MTPTSHACNPNFYNSPYHATMTPNFPSHASSTQNLSTSTTCGTMLLPTQQYDAPHSSPLYLAPAVRVNLFLYILSSFTFNQYVSSQSYP